MLNLYGVGGFGAPSIDFLNKVNAQNRKPIAAKEPEKKKPEEDKLAKAIDKLLIE